MARKKNNKIRIEFRKKHQSQVRDADLTEQYATKKEDIDTVSSSRVSGKGDLTRHRTVKGNLNDSNGETLGSVDLELDRVTIAGLVLRVHGLE
jgi:ribosome biogenesis GTPase